MLKEVWKKVRHPFTPASLVTIAHTIGDKEQITGNFYIKSIEDVHKVEGEMRKLLDRAEDDFRAKSIKVADELNAHREKALAIEAAKDAKSNKKGNK